MYKCIESHKAGEKKKKTLHNNIHNTLTLHVHVYLHAKKNLTNPISVLNTSVCVIDGLIVWWEFYYLSRLSAFCGGCIVPVVLYL